MGVLKIKRAYEPASKDDGYRILVDRLWPRGLTKEKVAAYIWLKDIAPSTELRKWYGHDPKKWHEFYKRYEHELKDKKLFIDTIKKVLRTHSVTLVYGARDEEHNEAAVLRDVLEKK